MPLLWDSTSKRDICKHLADAFYVGRKCRTLIATCLSNFAHTRSRVLPLRGFQNVSLPQYTHHLPGLEFEQYEGSSNRFYFFTATWAAPENSGVVVGEYAVDPFTGDVWSATSSCNELSTAKARKLQKTVRNWGCRGGNIRGSRRTGPYVTSKGFQGNYCRLVLKQKGRQALCSPPSLHFRFHRAT